MICLFLAVLRKLKMEKFSTKFTHNSLIEPTYSENLIFPHIKPMYVYLFNCAFLFSVTAVHLIYIAMHSIVLTYLIFVSFAGLFILHVTLMMNHVGFETSELINILNFERSHDTDLDSNPICILYTSETDSFLREKFNILFPVFWI